jgi:hypothetical protein
MWVVIDDVPMVVVVVCRGNRLRMTALRRKESGCAKIRFFVDKVVLMLDFCACSARQPLRSVLGGGEKAAGEKNPVHRK